MKKLIASLICAVLCCVAAATGCAKQVNYLNFVSEKRTNVYVYEDDDVSIKINCSYKEQPYSADGIKGEVGGLCEIFVSLPKNPQELEVDFEGFGGEMNYRAVDNLYYLSFTAEPFTKNSLEIKLTADGKENVYAALTVLYAGVLSCDEAVLCVVEHAGTLFESLTVNGVFDGEIFVRLLYDEGCYYYVGVCDKQKHVTAFLIDGEHGKVIATKETDG